MAPLVTVDHHWRSKSECLFNRGQDNRTMQWRVVGYDGACSVV